MHVNKSIHVGGYLHTTLAALSYVATINKLGSIVRVNVLLACRVQVHILKNKIV